MSKMLLSMVLFTNLKNVHIEDVDIAANYWLTKNIVAYNNKMWVNSSGILANSPTFYSVTKNNILHKNLPVIGFSFPHNPVQFGGIGIGINYPIEQSNTSGTIEDNEIFVKTNAVYDSAVCVGILLNKAVNATIRGNDIKLQNDMPVFSAFSRFYGINKSGGYDNTICGNDIKGLLNYDRGIGSSMSPGNITCNLIQFTRAGLYFTGDNKKPNAISGNEIADAYAGVYVNSLTNFQTSLGEQSYQGNKWVNYWKYGGLWDGNDVSTIDQSKFTNNDQYPFSPDIDDVVPNYWFDPSPLSNIFNNCIEDVGINSNDCNTSVTEGGAKLNSMSSDKDKLVEPYRSMVLRKSYAQIISAYHGISMPFEYKSFINENAETGFAKLAEIDYIVSHPLADFPELEQSILALSDSIQKIVPEFLVYQKTLDDLTFEGHINLGQTQTNATVNKLILLSVQLESKKHLADSIQNMRWTFASQLNNSLLIDNDYTNLERQINSIYLSLLIENQSSINSSDSMFIKTVAYYCPQDYGDAVFKARSIWAQIGNPYDKTWDNCFPETHIDASQNRSTYQEGKISKQPIVDLDKPTAYPVPSSDNLMVYLPESYVGSHYNVISSLGVAIEHGLFKESNNSLNATNWSNGIYFINLKAKDKRPITLKVVVQKL
jgi:Secretion system C-terminal sorting domain